MGHHLTNQIMDTLIPLLISGFLIVSIAGLAAAIVFLYLRSKGD